jgi:hypothetical protein
MRREYFSNINPCMKGGDDMKKKILLIFLVLLIPTIVSGQNKVEAPVWNVGDKWILSDDVMITIVNADEEGYAVEYSTVRGDLTLICEKSSLNRLYMDRTGRKKYEGRNKRLFNFPLDVGKTWNDKFVSRQPALGSQEMTYLETLTVLGWEEIVIQAGKFKALKLEYRQERIGQIADRPKEGKAWYWYSPDVKSMVKCQYEKSDYWDAIYDWEIISFKLKQ